MATCSQQLRVVTESGEGITGAKVVGAGKTVYSGYMGYTAIVAEKGSKHNVTASHVLYGSKTYSCTWDCDNTWLLVLKWTAPEDCTQRFIVRDEKLNPVPYAKVSGAGKTTTADGTGEARIQAEKGSKHNVTASRSGYITKTYICEWKCDNIIRLTIRKSTAACSLGINKSSFKIGEKITVTFKDVPSGTRLDALGAGGAGQTWSPVSGSGSRSYTFKSGDPTGSWVVTLSGSVCNASKTFTVTKNGGNGVKKDTYFNWKKWDKDAGTNQPAEYKLELMVKIPWLSDKVLTNTVCYLYVGGTKVDEKTTDGNGIVNFTYTFKNTGTYSVYAKSKEYTEYKAATSSTKQVTVTAPKSAYKVVVSGIPAGKTFKVEAFAESAVHLWEKDPNKTYSVTKDQNEAMIYRDDMGGSVLKDHKKHEHKIKLFSDTGVLLAEKTERALRADNDILVVNMIAGEGKRWRINFTYSKNPQEDKPFDVRAELIEAPGIPASYGMEVQFYEIIEGSPVELKPKNQTNDYGVAIRHVAGKPEGEYIFDAEYVHGDTQREPVTVVVGEEKPPSELLAFLKPVVDWVMTTFGMSEDERGTAETYTYIGLGFIAVAVLGGFMK
jgi:hypothetical protein